MMRKLFNRLSGRPVPPTVTAYQPNTTVPRTVDLHGLALSDSLHWLEDPHLPNVKKYIGFKQLSFTQTHLWDFFSIVS